MLIGCLLHNTFTREISFELERRNPVQTGQLNPQFHTFADLVNSVAELLIDWGIIPNFLLMESLMAYLH